MAALHFLSGIVTRTGRNRPGEFGGGGEGAGIEPGARLSVRTALRLILSLQMAGEGRNNYIRVLYFERERQA